MTHPSQCMTKLLERTYGPDKATNRFKVVWSAEQIYYRCLYYNEIFKSEVDAAFELFLSNSNYQIVSFGFSLKSCGCIS